MLKKRYLLSIALAISVFLSCGEVKAQGWPVFDATKLASLVSSLAAKLQGFPTALQNIKGMQDLQAVVNPQKLLESLGSLQSMGQRLQNISGTEAFSFGESVVASAGSNGPDEAARVAKESYFVEGEASQEDLRKSLDYRNQARDLAEKRQVATGLYMITNHDKDVEERTKAVDEALEKAAQTGALVDQMNANTLAVMANAYETMDQITLLMADMEKQVANVIGGISPGGYKKPEATVIDGKSIDKGEANVVLE